MKKAANSKKPIAKSKKANLLRVKRTVSGGGGKGGQANPA